MFLNILINSLLAIHVIVALLLILVVLMQRPKNEGLGAAFGGGMTDSLFGAQTTNVLQTFTRNLGIIFFLLAVVLTILYAKRSSTSSEVEERLRNKPAPPAAESTHAMEHPSPAAGVTPDTTNKTAPGANLPSEVKGSATPVPETEASPSAASAPVTKEVEKNPATSETTPTDGE
jgi:preprotein translocase subunit SecG